MITDEEYSALRIAGRAISRVFEALLIFCYETGHRVNSIRQLQWSDVDCDAAVIHWPEDTDKMGFAHDTAITEDVVKVLRALQKSQTRVCATYIFAPVGRQNRPLSRAALYRWFNEATQAAKLPTVARRGFHSFRRLFATAHKDVPLVNLAQMGAGSHRAHCSKSTRSRT